MGTHHLTHWTIVESTVPVTYILPIDAIFLTGMHTYTGAEKYPIWRHLVPDSESELGFQVLNFFSPMSEIQIGIFAESVI